MNKNPKLAISIAPKIAYTNSGVSLIRYGPGLNPCMIKAARIRAVEPLPGIPKANVGTIAPPAAALLAASGPTIPSGEPFPNLSFSLDHLLASLYPIIAATVEPSAGSIPIKVPIPDDLRIVYFSFFNSNNDGSLRALA